MADTCRLLKFGSRIMTSVLFSTLIDALLCSWDKPAGYAAPTGWQETKDPGTGKTYWFNAATGQTTWDNPNTGGGADVSAFVDYSVPRCLQCDADAGMPFV